MIIRYFLHSNKVRISLRTVFGGCLTALFAILLTGCADDVELKTGSVPDGYMKINFTIPDLERIVTRANETKEDELNERKINNLSILIFDSKGDHLLQKRDLTGTDLSISENSENSEFSVTFRLEGSAINASNPQVIAVANTKVTDNGEEKDLLDDLSINTDGKGSVENITHSTYLDKDNGFLMSGIMDSENKINLKRTAAKVTLQKDETAGDGFELTGFQIKNVASECYLMAANIDIPFSNGERGNEISVGRANAEGIFQTYLNPTEAYKDKEVKSFLIIEGSYKGQEGFYRIDLCSVNESGEKTYHNFNPNHWYEIHIVKVNGAGFSTVEEAAANESENIEVIIHDHVSKVTSMVSDGIRELGVTREIVVDETDENSVQTGELIIRVFDGSEGFDENNYPALAKTSNWSNLKGNENFTNGLEIWVEDHDSWITFSKIELTNEETDSDHLGDGDNHGRQFKITLGFTTSNSANEGKIHVSWAGLTRDVDVKYITAFDATKIFNSTRLFMHNSDAEEYQNKEQYNTSENRYFVYDYWAFLRGETIDFDYDYDSFKGNLYGVSGDANGLNKRKDQGFHFPINYGEKKWWYEYSIVILPTLQNDTFTYSIEREDNSSVWDNLSLGVANKSQYSLGSEIPGTERISLRMAQQYTGQQYTGFDDNYEYSTAWLVITRKSTKEQIKIRLYHTGFFHYQDGSAFNEDPGFYYYEVVPLEGDGTSKYWLDRNIGAKASGLYIENSKGESVLGNNPQYDFVEASMGGFYDISNSISTNGGPVANDKNICPPGYHVPTQKEFDAIMKSDRFHNEYVSNAGIGYYTSYILSENSNVGKIYFPKGRFYDNNGKTGITESGYYWTQTLSQQDPSGGLLKALFLNGTTSAYIDADMTTQRMSLRCVAGAIAP